MVDYYKVKHDLRLVQRCVFLVVACVACTLADFMGDWSCCLWIVALRAQWSDFAIIPPALISGDLHSHLEQTANIKGRHVDTVTRAKPYAFEACILVAPWFVRSWGPWWTRRRHIVLKVCRDDC